MLPSGVGALCWYDVNGTPLPFPPPPALTALMYFVGGSTVLMADF